MPKKQPDPEALDADPSPANRGDVPEDFRADLAPATEPQFNAATDDPAHPLHHHAKRDSLESPPPSEE